MDLDEMAKVFIELNLASSIIGSCMTITNSIHESIFDVTLRGLSENRTICVNVSMLNLEHV